MCTLDVWTLPVSVAQSRASVVALVLASLHLQFWAGMPATRVLLAVDMRPRCITWERKVLSGKHVTCELQNAAAVFTRIIPELDMPHRCAYYFRYMGKVVLPTCHELAAYFGQFCLLVVWQHWLTGYNASVFGW